MLYIHGTNVLFGIKFLFNLFASFKKTFCSICVKQTVLVRSLHAPQKPHAHFYILLAVVIALVVWVVL